MDTKLKVTQPGFCVDCVLWHDILEIALAELTSKYIFVIILFC
jgi:hypothetical protein